MRRLPNNFKCADIICDFCGYLAQVKTSRSRVLDVVPDTILGAAWNVQKERIVEFICFEAFSLLDLSLPDVDHFFPHALKKAGFAAEPIDGVWNLVLVCLRCNRGIDVKSDRVPTIRLLECLHTRNEFLIDSHHPLCETLMSQTGMTEPQRKVFLNSFHGRAMSALIHEWEPKESSAPVF